MVCIHTIDIHTPNLSSDSLALVFTGAFVALPVVLTVIPIIMR